MLSRRTFLSTLALSSVSLPTVLARLREAGPPLPQYTPVRNLRPKTIAIVGDIQGTLWVEGFAMAREQNSAATKRIVWAIVADKPDMILLLGDQVTDGSDETDWRLFDDQVKPITDANIPVYALRGNHDYGIQDRS